MKKLIFFWTFFILMGVPALVPPTPIEQYRKRKKRSFDIHDHMNNRK